MFLYIFLLIPFFFINLSKSDSTSNFTQLLNRYISYFQDANNSIFYFKKPMFKDDRVKKFYGQLSGEDELIAYKNLQYDLFQDIDYYNTSNKICSGNNKESITYDVENNFVNCPYTTGYRGYFLTFQNITYQTIKENFTIDLKEYLKANYSSGRINSIEEFSYLLNISSIFFPFTQYCEQDDLPEMLIIANSMHDLLITANVSFTYVNIVSMVEFFLDQVLDNFGTYIDFTDYILMFLPDSNSYNRVYRKVSYVYYNTLNASDTYLNFTTITKSKRLLATNTTNISISSFSSFFFNKQNYVTLNYTSNSPFIFIPKSLTDTFSLVKYVAIHIKDPRIYITKGSPGIKSQLVLIKALGEEMEVLYWPNTPDAIRIIIPWAFPPFIMIPGYDFMDNCRIHIYNKDSGSWTQVFGIIDPSSNEYYVIIYVNNFGLYGVSCINNQRAALLLSETSFITYSYCILLLILVLLIL